jgi:hypothetical protein
MTTCKECSKSSLGRIIADTRPGRSNIYLDGEIVLDSSGQIAKTPTVIHNVVEGIHTVTFSKSGYKDITILANMKIGPEGSDCHARAVLNTSMWSYPMMLSEQPYPIDTLQESSEQPYPIDTLQPSPGWPYIPVKQVTYGHMVTSTIPDGAEIYLDNRPVIDINGNIATTPSSVTGIITGTHTVTFKKVGYMNTSITINIQNGLYSDARAILQIQYINLGQ